MEDRAFELLEKLYSEFTSFKQDITKKVDAVDKKTDKNSLLLEHMDEKIKILAEVQQNHYEMNERQHEEMNETNKEQLEILKSALQNISQRI